MKVFPSALISEKNKMTSSHPWVTCVDFQYGETDWLYYTNFPNIYKFYKKYHNDYSGDRDKLVFPYPSGTEYTYKRFSLGGFTEEIGGKVSNTTISFDNIDREMEYFIHANELRGYQMIIRRVNLDLATDSLSQRVDHYLINGITANISTVTLNLGHSSIVAKEFGERLIKQCNHVFGDSRCKHTIVGAQECTGFLGNESDIPADETCRGYDNEINFGGYVWMRSFLE